MALATQAARVLVVGGGISGIACARAVAAAGVPVTVVDRGHRLGGRMAVRTIGERAVDVGASYFTVRDDAFRAVVANWLDRGLARPWTDTFHLATLDGLDGTTTALMRYGSPHGLRALVEDLADGLDIRYPYEVSEVGPGTTVDGEAYEVAALAMPDPQALDLLSADLVEERAVLGGHDWEPALALAAGWDERIWAEFDGAFVDESPVLAWVADDGRRRGDGAPVLVAHSTPVFAASRLDVPQAGREPMLHALRDLLEIAEEPRWVEVRRWSLASPMRPHDQPFHLGESEVGCCGDGWGGKSRIEGAYLSGHRLGEAIADRLA